MIFPVMKLDLSEKDLTALPPRLDLTQVTELDLSSNRFKTVPDTVLSMTQLRGLNLADNPISHLPEGLSALKNLEDLQLFDTELQTIPEAVWALTQLRKLNVATTSISDLPEGLSALKNLETLNLFQCPVTSIPDWIADFANLEYLGFSNHEGLTYVTPRLGEMASLKSLVISGDYTGNDLGRFLEKLARVVGPMNSPGIDDFTLRYFRDPQAALDALETLEYGAVGGAAAFRHRIAAVFSNEETKQKMAALMSAAELFIEADSFFADRDYEWSREAELKEQLPGRREALISGLETLRPDLEIAFPEVVSPACYGAGGHFDPEYLKYPHEVASRLKTELEKAFRVSKGPQA